MRHNWLQDSVSRCSRCSCPITCTRSALRRNVMIARQHSCNPLTYTLLWVLRLSRRWYFKSKSSGLWHRVLLWEDTNVSEAHAASIFREAAWAFETLASYHNTTPSLRKFLGYCRRESVPFPYWIQLQTEYMIIERATVYVLRPTKLRKSQVFLRGINSLKRVGITW
jgi:hypothetical protein